MSDQITVTNPDSSTEFFEVYYSAENRQKRIVWVTGGSGNGFANINSLYSALQDQFDELNQMDDGTVMSAQTPTEYTIGIIDSGDNDPWFIDRVSVEHLTGGALRTSSWTRSTGSDTGIVRLDYTVGAGTDFDTSDIGLTVTHSVGGDSGTLLDFVSDGSNGTAWIRPADDTAGNDWDSTGASIAVTGGTGTGLAQDAAAVTGNSLWANIFTIGTIEDNTHIYVNQNALTGGQEAELLTGYKSTTDWWEDGQIDILVNVSEVGVEIDDAVLQVFARQHTKTYDHFELTDLSSGGRNPVPLSTGNDLDNQVGFRTLDTDAETGGGWDSDDVGTVITDDTDPTKQAVVTSVTGTGPNYTFEYYLIGDPLTDFEDNDVFEDPGQTKTATVFGAPSDANASLWTDVTITFGPVARDINENDANEDYSILINCGTRSDLQEVYQRLKYVTRRGDVVDIFAAPDSSGTMQGQFYIGEDRRITYTGFSTPGNFSVGETLTGSISGAEAFVVADHNNGDGTGYVIVRNTRRGGSNNNQDFHSQGAETITGGTSGETATTSVVATITTPKASPFGTFAGGQFFGAAGVVLDNVPAADASNYQLIDDTGTVVNPPTKVAVQVTNTRENDKIAVFRLSSGVIEKDYYTVDAAGAIGGSTITITATPAGIRVDEPGKTTGGVLRLVDGSADQEYRIRFASWTGNDFTLDTQESGVDFTLQAGTDTDTLVGDTGDFTDNEVGDIVINATQGNAVAYVVEKTDNETLQISPAISGQTSTDLVYINAIPVTLEIGVDTVYVPFIDVFEAEAETPVEDGFESTTVTFDATVSVRVRARHADIPANDGIIPYSADSTITSSGMTNSIIRTPDTIFTP